MLVSNKIKYVFTLLYTRLLFRFSNDVVQINWSTIQLVRVELAEGEQLFRLYNLNLERASRSPPEFLRLVRRLCMNRAEILRLLFGRADLRGA